MESLTFQEKIDALLQLTKLSHIQRRFLSRCYTQPGLDFASLKKKLCLTCEDDCFSLEELFADQLMIEHCLDDGKEVLYPIPIALLRGYLDHSKVSAREFDYQIREIEQWIKYPMMRTGDTRFQTGKGWVANQWLFELLAADWVQVYCFGDYESFIDMMGIDAERDWIRERIKRGKKAQVLATQDGQWAQEIDKHSRQELRDCLIDPSDFSDLFIMTFPESQTTVMANRTGDITFVCSSLIAERYSMMVKDGIQADPA